MGQYGSFDSTDALLEMTHFGFVPATPEVLDKEHTGRPRLYAAFSPVLDGKTMDVHVLGQSTMSIWEVREETPHLDDIFSELGPKKSTAGGFRAEHRLFHIEDVFFQRIITHIAQVRPGLMVAVALCDGTVQFRYRHLVPVLLDDNMNAGSTLPEAGFTLMSDPALHAAFSLNYCLMGTSGLSREPKVSALQLQTDILSDIFVEKVIATFALLLAAVEGSTPGQTHFLDLIVAIQDFLQRLPEERREQAGPRLVQHSYRSFLLADKLNQHIDIRMPQITSCLSLQGLFASKNGPIKRTLTCFRPSHQGARDREARFVPSPDLGPFRTQI